MPYTRLSVDFFYVLSGFVVAYAYEKRLQAEAMDIKTFLLVRTKRLYPLIFLGTGCGIVLAILAALTKKTVSMHEVLEAGALGLLVLPSFVIPRWPTAYPFNMASWSLTFEAFVNVVYGLIAKRLSDRLLVVVIALSSLALVWLAYADHGINGGNNQRNWAFGFVRVIFPFFAGVLVYRFRPSPRHSSAASIALLVGLPALLFADWPGYNFMSVVYVTMLFPAVVFVGSAVQASSRISAFCTFAGALSYPVYILQAPVLRLGDEAGKHVHLSGVRLTAFDVAEAGAVIAVAWLGLRFFDQPIQELLRRRIEPASRLPLSQRP